MAGFLGAEFKLVILVGLRGITGGEGLCSNQRLRKNASMLLVGEARMEMEGTVLLSFILRCS